jgi:hypothetical protein
MLSLMKDRPEDFERLLDQLGFLLEDYGIEVAWQPIEMATAN